MQNMAILSHFKMKHYQIVDEVERKKKHMQHTK